MIAIDSNILVRYLTQDDPAQAALAARLIDERLSSEEPGFVSLPVMCEVAWVLRKRYRFARAKLVAVMTSLLEVRQFAVERPEIVLRALSGNVDIAGAIIHEIGRARGCARTVTFDRRFARLEGVELVA